LITVSFISILLNNVLVEVQFPLYRQEGNSWKKIYEDKLNYTAFHRTDINGIKYGPDFFERMFQMQFHHLKFETFSDIDLNKISKWNYLDFSKLVIT